MCELFGMSASQPITIRRELSEFRLRGGLVADNPDGWGLAWREKGNFQLAKAPEPAFRSTLFEDLGEKLNSSLVIAHVRKANFPPINTLNNTHPFQRTCCGKGWVFAHNGLVLAGAGHEHGLRPGTENVALIAALGMAARLAHKRLPKAQVRLQAMRDLLHLQLLAGIPHLILNGHAEARLPNTLNISFPGVSGHELLAEAAQDVAASTGSACHSGGHAVSGVLGAMKVSALQAVGAVRLSVGLHTTPADIERAAQALITAWRRLHS